MSDKYFLLELDYELKENELRGDGSEDIRNAHVTRNLINVAFQLNHRDGMDSKSSRQWRSITKKVEKAIDKKKNFVIFSDSDFSSVYDEVYKCKYSPSLGYLAPVLYDELDRIKNRKPEDEDSLLKNARETENLGEKLDKVVEMSKRT